MSGNIKKAIILLAEGFEDIEAVTVIDIVRRAQIEVTVAGVGGRQIKASRATLVTADTTIEKIDSDYDACICPGGMPGASNLASSDKVRSLLMDMHTKGKIIAAICAAPAVVLAPLGILHGKSATCYPSMKDDLGSGITYKEDPVVIDGTVITSRGPATALSFALAIVEKLCGKEMSDAIRASTLAAEIIG